VHGRVPGATAPKKASAKKEQPKKSAKKEA